MAWAICSKKNVVCLNGLCYPFERLGPSIFLEKIEGPLLAGYLWASGNETSIFLACREHKHERRFLLIGYIPSSLDCFSITKELQRVFSSTLHFAWQFSCKWNRRRAILPQTLKFKSQVAIAFFVNHLNGPLRKQNFTLTGSKGHGLWFMISGFRSVLCVSVFQGSLLVIVIMIAKKTQFVKATFELWKAQ